MRGAAAAALLAGAALLSLARPAAAGAKGIRLLNATQIDNLLSKPVPVPVPHNQTAVEKKAALFREVREQRARARGPSPSVPQPTPLNLPSLPFSLSQIIHLPDGGRQKPYFALNVDKPILVNTLCDQVRDRKKGERRHQKHRKSAFFLHPTHPFSLSLSR